MAGTNRQNRQNRQMVRNIKCHSVAHHHYHEAAILNSPFRDALEFTAITGVFSMRAMRMLGYAMLLWSALACTVPARAAAQPDRQVAITIDDLPASAGAMPAAEITK